jgi:hypothetical protein
VQLELRCTNCSAHFGAVPETSDDEILDRMFHEGLWYALGPGKTFEDMIVSSLITHGCICCPECSEPVALSQDGLGWADSSSNHSSPLSAKIKHRR